MNQISESSCTILRRRCCQCCGSATPGPGVLGRSCGYIPSCPMTARYRLPAAVRADSVLRALALALLVATTPSADARAAAAAAPNHIPKYFVWMDEPPELPLQQQLGANLVWSESAAQLEAAWRNHSMRGMWDITPQCTPNVDQMFYQPYCGGPSIGLAANWTVGADFTAKFVQSRPWIVGLHLGDEPEIQGVPSTQMCELSIYLKRALQRAGRRDVWLTYNDGPSSHMLQGLCPGLDYFSIDKYVSVHSLVYHANMVARLVRSYLYRLVPLTVPINLSLSPRRVQLR
jgi:hypothetical protein